MDFAIFQIILLHSKTLDTWSWSYLENILGIQLEFPLQITNTDYRLLKLSQRQLAIDEKTKHKKENILNGTI